MFASRSPSTSLLLGFFCVLAVLLAAAPARSELRGHGGFVKGVAVTPDGRRAVTASFDYTLIVWDLEGQQAVEVLDDHEGAVNAVALFDEGRHALSASDDGTLRLWSLADGGRLEHVFTGHGGKVAGVAVAPDGRLAASAAWDGTVRLWDLVAREQLFVLDEHHGNVNAVAFSHDGRHLLTGSYDSTIRYFELPEAGRPRLVATMEGHDFGVNALAFLPGDDKAISASVDETLRLWDLRSGEEIAVLRGHKGPVFAVAVSPDGHWAASGGVDGAINLWHLDEQRVVATLYGHRQPVWALAFAPDGRRLLSAGADAVTRVWDLVSRSEIGASGAVADAAQPTAAEAPDSRGAELFRKCVACHSVTADGGNRAGPTLYGVFGRRAGTLDGYNYSNALRHSDLVWTEETIDRLFALGPDEFTPGSKMPLQRMPSAEDREDLIAYLKTITAPEGQTR